MTVSTPLREPTHYDALQISAAFLSEQKDHASVLKRAYHRALLRHHPDKTTVDAATPPQPVESSPETTITVDRITEAFRVLSDPASKAAYDKQLRLQRSEGRQLASSERDNFQTGIETADLDDLDYDQDKLCWFRSCRCGNERGFLLFEHDLIEASEHGEIVVGCQDCSLWVRVHFMAVDD